MNTKKQLRTKALVSSTILSMLVAATAVQADDIEVYLQPPPDPVAPNVLFILDESGSMSSSTPSRMSQLKDAMTTLLNAPDMSNTRAGIMGYTTNGGENRPLRIRVLADFTELGDVGSTARTSMISAVDTLTPRSYTPSVKALEFAADWFNDGFNQGENPVGWDNNDDDGDGNHNDRNTWDSPVDLWCRPNHMVLLTDGRPNSNSPTAREAYGLTDYRPTDTFGSTNCPAYSNWEGAHCAPEIASWANNTDLRTESDWPEQQRIITHTIGFHTNDSAEEFLTTIATNGGGNFYTADNTGTLIAAFAAIVEEAQTSVPFTYNAPTIPFNANNAATSGNDLYVPLFATDTKKFWKGNIKKYHISYNTTTDDIDIKDRNNLDVLDTAQNFQPGREDYWNATGNADDGDPLKGGAASNMDGNLERFLYTHLDDPTNPSPTADLTHDDNRITLDNTLITEDMLGVANENKPDRKRRNMLNWANWLTNNGNNPRTGEDAPAMGAPLHTSPIVVRYSGGKELILINTTEGVLHAFDSTTTGAGAELWAFMPDELLNTIKLAKRNKDSALPMYGLDGPMTYYELNNNKYIVFGMRRGGRNYYALDISDPEKPVFAWEIKGGTPSFNNLGQTWSKPIFTKLHINSAEREVLIFGGGYDTRQDTTTTRPNDDDLGNVIFIVDAATGLLIQEIDSSDIVEGSMTSSIASDVLPIDINTDGLTDRLYAADVGGRIIRIDIPDPAIAQITGSSDLTGTIVADVGGQDGFQRFFNTPEVAYYDRGGIRYLALMITSGHRPSPLDDSVTDRFYMIKDPNVWAAPADHDNNGSPDYGAIITEAGDGSAENPGLYNATNNQVQEGGSGNVNDTGSKLYAQEQLRQKKGWYIDLASGEKGFSAAKVYDYAVLFTTYKGSRSANSDPCMATSTAGESQLYIVDMTSGAAVFQADGSKFVKNGSDDAPLDANDRNVPLSIPGMPPAPVLTFPEEKRIANAIVGLQSAAQWPDRFHAISWEQAVGDEE